MVPRVTIPPGHVSLAITQNPLRACSFKRFVVKTAKEDEKMPGKVAANPLPPSTKQPGLAQSLLYSGSRFQGHQKSKGNRYDVEVVLQVCVRLVLFYFSSVIFNLHQTIFPPLLNFQTSLIHLEQHYLYISTACRRRKCVPLRIPED